MELQQNTAYRNAYNSAWPGAGDLPGGPRMGYPFPPMPGHNAYPTYNHLGYPGAGSPGRDGKAETEHLYRVTTQLFVYVPLSLLGS